jgi:hypothetical protein
VLNPNNSIQMIAFGKPSGFPEPVLIQAADNVVSHPNIQRGAALIGEDVHPIIVVAHTSRIQSEMFRFAQHDRTPLTRCHSERSEESQIIFLERSPANDRDVSTSLDMTDD